MDSSVVLIAPLIRDAIIIEIIATPIVCISLLKPLSRLISDENSYKKTFIILFLIRILILVIFNLFITTLIAYIDFALIFIGVPIISIIKTKKGIPVFEPEIEKSSFGLTNSFSVRPICKRCKHRLKERDMMCPICGEPNEFMMKKKKEVKDENK